MGPGTEWTSTGHNQNSRIRSTTADLARLLFSMTVCEADVDEAMRLVHMSKASLLDDDDHGTDDDDVMDFSNRSNQIDVLNHTYCGMPMAITKNTQSSSWWLSSGASAASVSGVTA